MGKLWRTIKAWQERRRRAFLLGKWARIRKKGKNHFGVRESVLRALLLSSCLGVSHWYDKSGFSLRALVTSDVLLYWSPLLVFSFLVFFLFAVDRDWDANEKSYSSLVEEQTTSDNEGQLCR